MHRGRRHLDESCGARGGLSPLPQEVSCLASFAGGSSSASSSWWEGSGVAETPEGRHIPGRFRDGRLSSPCGERDKGLRGSSCVRNSFSLALQRSPLHATSPPQTLRAPPLSPPSIPELLPPSSPLCSAPSPPGPLFLTPFREDGVSHWFARGSAWRGARRSCARPVEGGLQVHPTSLRGGKKMEGGWRGAGGNQRDGARKVGRGGEDRRQAGREEREAT